MTALDDIEQRRRSAMILHCFIVVQDAMLSEKVILEKEMYVIPIVVYDLDDL
jgi:hypothetical protein